MGYAPDFVDIDEDEYEEWDDEFEEYEDGECWNCDGLGEVLEKDAFTGAPFWAECEICLGNGFFY